MTAIYATEIFSAIQGEGEHIGARQVFLRLAGCNIRCSYCDQPEALERRPGPFMIEQVAGRRDWLEAASPLDHHEIAAHIANLWGQVRHEMLSVTGGEPLFQATGIVPLLDEIASRSIPVALETNGTLPARLRQVLGYLSHVSMDLKLNSADGENVRLDTHRRFIETLLEHSGRTGRPTLSMKIVLGAHLVPRELEEAISMIHECAPDAHVFLQPVTPYGDVLDAPAPADVLTWQAAALDVHPFVRVVPQTHKLIGQR